MPKVAVHTFNSRGVREMLKKLMVKLTDKLRELASERGMQPRAISCQCIQQAKTQSAAAVSIQNSQTVATSAGTAVKDVPARWVC